MASTLDHDEVKNWAMQIENYILKLAMDGIKTKEIQCFFNQATYTTEKLNGSLIVMHMKEKFGGIFEEREEAIKKVAKKVAELHEKYYKAKHASGSRNLPNHWADSDIPSSLKNLKFNSYFRQKTTNASAVQIPDGVSRNSTRVIEVIDYTSDLNDVFQKNTADNVFLKWQYFSSIYGPTRVYPGFQKRRTFIGFFENYDPRHRPWYIAATSGPKDVVIILDCSLSMEGEQFNFAKKIANTVIETLTKHDYVGVICAQAMYWDLNGKLHNDHTTTVLGCNKKRKAPAVLKQAKHLNKKIGQLTSDGTGDFRKAFEIANRLLSEEPRTDCQSIIIFVTDGMEEDGDQVRCGKGHYVRTGYVPGPLCSSHWNEALEVIKRMPQVNVFIYLTQGNKEPFTSKQACENNVRIKTLSTSNENIVGQIDNYFQFLISSYTTITGIWSSPYIDAFGLGFMMTYAVPVISTINESTIGVAGVDVTLDEIEYFLKKDQHVFSRAFLISKGGEAIFHPSLKPSSELQDNPILMPISKLETDVNSSEFSEIEKEMKNGSTGQRRIEKTADGIPKTYYYTTFNGSKFSFGYRLPENETEFQGLNEPLDGLNSSSYYHLFPLLENSENIETNESYPCNFSTFSLAPKVYCNPIQYLYNENLTSEILDVQNWINGKDPDIGCYLGSKQKFEKGIRAGVLITQQIEKTWKERNLQNLSEVLSTFIGLRSGVFRIYPGQRSRKDYDCTESFWYKKTVSAPELLTVSPPRMSSSGSAKLVTISQAVFTNVADACQKNQTVNLNMYQHSAKHVQAVAGLDIDYDEFYKKVLEATNNSCNHRDRCSDSGYTCETRCHLFDKSSYLVLDPSFIYVNTLEESKYQEVSLGQVEGEVMKALLYKHLLFTRMTLKDFQGTCSKPTKPKVTLEGIPTTAEEIDNYYKWKGELPKFNEKFGCIQDVVEYRVNESALVNDPVITGKVSGPCMSGTYYVMALKKTNLYLLVIKNWEASPAGYFNFNCRIAQSVFCSGSYEDVNGHCTDEYDLTVDRESCPICRENHTTCATSFGEFYKPNFLVLFTEFLVICLMLEPLKVKWSK